MKLLCRVCPHYCRHFLVFEARAMVHSEEGRRVGITGIQDGFLGKGVGWQI